MAQPAEPTATTAQPNKVTFECKHAHSELITIGISLVEHSDCKETLIENALKSIIDNPEMTLEISAATLLMILEDSNSPEARSACQFIRAAAAARDKRDAKLLS